MIPESPLTEAHRAAGAELAHHAGEEFGVLLPAQFRASSHGAQAEHETARTSVGLIDTNFRAVFHLTGADRVRYFNAVTTGNIRDLKTGQSALGLLLNPQGHVLAELLTLAMEDRLVILGHQMRRAGTMQTLDKFIIMDDAALTDETDGTCTVAIEGPAASRVLQDLVGITLEQIAPGGHATANVTSSGAAIPCHVLRHSLFGYPGVEILAAREAVHRLWSAASEAVRAHGGAPIGYRALNMLRLEAGVPWFGAEFDEQHIPHEAGLEKTHISFTKGCYTGQEIVERVRSRGHVNRRLTGLRFDTTEPPAPGALLMAEGTDVGQVTSAAFSPLLGSAIGMGYLRREYQQPGTVLECGSMRVEAIELPLAAAAPTSA